MSKIKKPAKTQKTDIFDNLINFVYEHKIAAAFAVMSSLSSFLLQRKMNNLKSDIDLFGKRNEILKSTLLPLITYISKYIEPTEINAPPISINAINKDLDTLNNLIGIQSTLIELAQQEMYLTEILLNFSVITNVASGITAFQTDQQWYEYAGSWYDYLLGKEAASSEAGL